MLGPGWVSPSALVAARSSADLTRVMTAVTKPSSQLRRQARALRTPSGTTAAVRPWAIWSSSEVYRMSARSRSEAKPKTWIRAPGPLVLSRTHWHRMAPANPASRWARTCAHGLEMSMMRLPGRSVSGRVAASRARSMP